MGESNKSKVKMIFPAIVLVTSFRYSFLFTTGIVIGYVLSKIFCNLFWKKGKVNSVIIDFGKWKFHFHHWIMGAVILAVVWVLDYFYLPTFFAGAVIGVIIQDIYDYNDWHQVILKNEDKKEAIAS